MTLRAGALGCALAVAVPGTAQATHSMFVPLSASMTDKRAYAVASPLPDGTVLIAGGEDGANNLNTAEIYDPTTETFTALANTMTKARVGATAGLLPPTMSDPDGHVIIAGGDGLAGGDLYDPVTQTFTAGNEGPAQPRTSGAGAVIDGGNEMLIAGGITEFYFEDTGELYNRANDTYLALGATLSSERYLLPAAAPLPGGGVLVVGGLSALNDFPMISADIYDSTTESFTEATGRMSVAREAPLAAPLPDGRVLVAGGFNGDTVNRSAEIYDPTTQTFAPVGTLPDQQMSIPRYAAVAAPLPDGTVLIAGGQTSYSGDIRASAEVFRSRRGALRRRQRRLPLRARRAEIAGAVVCRDEPRRSAAHDGLVGHHRYWRLRDRQRRLRRPAAAGVSGQLHDHRDVQPERERRMLWVPRARQRRRRRNPDDRSHRHRHGRLPSLQPAAAANADHPTDANHPHFKHTPESRLLASHPQA